MLLEVGIVAAVVLFALLPAAGRRLAIPDGRLALVGSLAVIALVFAFGVTEPPGASGHGLATEIIGGPVHAPVPGENAGVHTPVAAGAASPPPHPAPSEHPGAVEAEHAFAVPEVPTLGHGGPGHEGHSHHAPGHEHHRVPRAPSGSTPLPPDGNEPPSHGHEDAPASHPTGHPHDDEPAAPLADGAGVPDGHDGHGGHEGEAGDGGGPDHDHGPTSPIDGLLAIIGGLVQLVGSAARWRRASSRPVLESRRLDYPTLVTPKI